jgi:hypothetical protein
MLAFCAFARSLGLRGKVLSPNPNPKNKDLRARNKALKHIIIYKNPEDGKWMEQYGENQREITKGLLDENLFDEGKDD